MCREDITKCITASNSRLQSDLGKDAITQGAHVDELLELEWAWQQCETEYLGYRLQDCLQVQETFCYYYYSYDNLATDFGQWRFDYYFYDYLATDLDPRQFDYYFYDYLATDLGWEDAGHAENEGHDAEERGHVDNVGLYRDYSQQVTKERLKLTE